jgi:Ubiquinone biosynthesis protein COQ7
MRLTKASVKPAPPDAKEAAIDDLVAILQLAYSGELAAALAYRGHWNSVSDAEDRQRIRQIEEEEWRHRDLVGAMLRDLGESPSRLREVRAWLIGRTLGILCHISGWLAPMYGAGKLESRNVREYEAAARHALACGRDEWVDCLLTMAEIEWEHEAFFRSRVLSHRVGRRLRIWPALPPKEVIRESFERDAQALRGQRRTFACA